MRWYPFDAQTCFMVMKLGGDTEMLVSLDPGLLEYLGPEELTRAHNLFNDNPQLIVITINRNRLAIKIN